MWGYLNNYTDLGLYYNCDIPYYYSNLRAYSDASWASQLDNRKSVTGYAVFLYKNIISWQTSTQKAIALSSCEAEYMAIRDTARELVFISNVYTYINNAIFNSNYRVKIPPILTDNEAALKISYNSEFHKKTKHIDIAYHYTRELVKNKKIAIFFIRGKDNIADFFTKPLGLNNYNNFKQDLCLK